MPNSQFPARANAQCPMPNSQCLIPNYYEIAEEYIHIDSRRAKHDWVSFIVRDASFSAAGSG